MKAIIILAIVLLLGATTAGVGFYVFKNKDKLFNKNKSQTTELFVSGERDANGCLTTEGYTYNSQVKACVRTGQLTGEQLDAANLALSSLESKDKLTIIEVLNGSEIGTYRVVLERVDNSRLAIEIKNNRVMDSHENGFENLTTEELEQIKALLVTKNKLNSDTTKVALQKKLGDYATGGVGQVNIQSGGGIWFAAKKGGQWNLVWDGNGVVQCSSLAEFYDFPKELIAECFDSKTGKMVIR